MERNTRETSKKLSKSHQNFSDDLKFAQMAVIKELTTEKLSRENEENFNLQVKLLYT